jgi:hypothetical protein
MAVDSPMSFGIKTKNTVVSSNGHDNTRHLLGSQATVNKTFSIIIVIGLESTKSEPCFNVSSFSSSYYQVVS